MTTAMHTRSCRWGLIGMESAHDPFSSSYCHCRDCRRQSGAPVMAFVGFRETDLVWHGTPQTGAPAAWSAASARTAAARSAIATQNCRARSICRSASWTNLRNIRRRLHRLEQRRLPFLHIVDDLPRTTASRSTAERDARDRNHENSPSPGSRITSRPMPRSTRSSSASPRSGSKSSMSTTRQR